MNLLEQIIENFPDEEFIKIDGYDDAVIGVEATELRLVYDTTKMIECLVKNGMTHDEAIEWFEYNTMRSIPYIKNAPIVIYTDFF